MTIDLGALTPLRLMVNGFGTDKPNATTVSLASALMRHQVAAALGIDVKALVEANQNKTLIPLGSATVPSQHGGASEPFHSNIEQWQTKQDYPQAGSTAVRWFMVFGILRKNCPTTHRSPPCH